jgi:hypothetical protein
METFPALLDFLPGAIAATLSECVRSDAKLWPHLGTARYGAWQRLPPHPGSCSYNNLHPPCTGMPAALSHEVVLRKTGRKRLNVVVSIGDHRCCVSNLRTLGKP